MMVMRPCAMLLRRCGTFIWREQQCSRHVAQSSHTTSTPSPLSTPVLHLFALHRRKLSSSTSLLATPSTTPARPKSKAPTGPIRDDAIRAWWVMMVDPDSGSLVGPLQPRHILRDMDRSRSWLVQVSAGRGGVAEAEASQGEDGSRGRESRPSPVDRFRSGGREADSREDSGARRNRISPPEPDEDGSYASLPIVKMVDKKIEFDKARDAKRKAKERGGASSSSAASGPPKEIQLSWSVSPNDLQHKLVKARTELTRRGTHVRIDIITRKGGPRVVAGGEAAKKREALIKTIEDELCRLEEKEETTVGDGDTGEAADTAKSTPFTAKLVRSEWKAGGSICKLYFEASKSKR